MRPRSARPSRRRPRSSRANRRARLPKGRAKAHMGGMNEIAHPLFRSIGRGLAHRCPACGQGAMFWRYLKVEPVCKACGHELDLYPADDGPAYLTILLIGHLIIAPLLFVPLVWQSPPQYSLPIL